MHNCRDLRSGHAPSRRDAGLDAVEFVLRRLLFGFESEGGRVFFALRFATRGWPRPNESGRCATQSPVAIISANGGFTLEVNAVVAKHLARFGVVVLQVVGKADIQQAALRVVFEFANERAAVDVEIFAVVVGDAVFAVGVEIQAQPQIINASPCRASLEALINTWHDGAADFHHVGDCLRLIIHARTRAFGLLDSLARAAPHRRDQITLSLLVTIEHLRIRQQGARNGNGLSVERNADENHVQNRAVWPRISANPRHDLRVFCFDFERHRQLARRIANCSPERAQPRFERFATKRRRVVNRDAVNLARAQIGRNESLGAICFGLRFPTGRRLN